MEEETPGHKRFVQAAILTLFLGLWFAIVAWSIYEFLD